MIAAPAKPTMHPATSRLGKPSRRNSPLRIATKTGPVFTSMAAVPASTVRSAWLSNRLYAPNQSNPHASNPGTSPRRGSGCRRTTTSTPSATLPTSKRASAREPGASTRPAAWIPTNAEAHRTTVAIAAASAMRLSRGGTPSVVTAPSLIRRDLRPDGTPAPASTRTIQPPPGSRPTQARSRCDVLCLGDDTS